MAGRTGKPVTRVPAFWDASALAPLCVRQGITPQAIALYKTHDAVVWWATPVEIASALARLLRMKQLDSRAWARSHKLAGTLADSWSVIQPSDALRATSTKLVDRYDLRAADSFQLAAALEWCEYAPQGRVFERRSKVAGCSPAQRLRCQADVIRSVGRDVEGLRADASDGRALEWHEYTPQAVVFLSADQKLRDAVRLGRGTEVVFFEN